MARIMYWIKMHKLAMLLLLILAYVVWRNNAPYAHHTIPSFRGETFDRRATGSFLESDSGIASPSFISDSQIPPIESTQRLTVKNSRLSLLVENVVEVTDAIIAYAERVGGYMVESSLNNPQESATATITVRIPAEKRKSTLSFFRSQGVKVVSENLTGRDVTDEFEDINARLELLSRNKARFEEIMAQAVEINDIVKIQQELLTLQTQIDQLKGRQKYLEQTARLSKITVFLSTDEFALPYTPDQPWRPEVIFKKAVRSLIGTFQKAGTLIIWATVYSIVWAPAIGIFFYLRKKKRLNPPS